MAEYRAGSLEFRGRSYPFETSEYEWCSGGSLIIKARGDRCWLSLVGIPFPGASEIVDLAGRSWEADEDEFGDDIFMEGGLEIRRRRFSFVGCRVECRRFNPERGILTVAFDFRVKAEEDAREDDVEGVAYCRVAAPYQ